MTRIALILATVLQTLASVHAQQAYPMLMSIEPVAAQIGQTSDHTVRSRYTMEGAYKVLVSGEGVTGQVVLPEADDEDAKKKSPLQSLKVTFAVTPDAVPGVRDVRIATPNGISTTGQLVIAHDQVLVESGNNNSFAEANEVSLPATICGRIEKAEDVDYFKVQVKAGDTWYFHVRCMRLQDRIHDLQQHADPMLSLRNATGSIIAAADNNFAADPQLAHTFTESGEYFIELRDVRYQGNQYWNYSVEVSQRPFVQAVYPLALSADNTEPVQLVGQGFDQASRGIPTVDPESELGLQDVPIAVSDESTQLVRVLRTAHDTELETSAENDSVETAQSLSLPISVSGRIERAGDTDYFRFAAQKGDRLSVEVTARRAGSSLDPHVRILNEQGKQQQLNDDMRVGKRTFADSLVENWLVPADGTYAIEVRDVHLRGGPTYVYFLSATEAVPHFRLFTDTDKTPLRPGTSGVVYVRAEKKSGFDGEIQLQVDELPPGVTAACGKILAGNHQDGCIVLTAREDAKPLATPIAISGFATGTAADKIETLSDAATVYQEIYRPGGGRGHWPVHAHVVSVGDSGDILNVKLTPHDITLARGESAAIDIEIERAEGFDKNVTLEVIYQHLNTIYGDPLPNGVSVDKSASKVLLTGGATKGKIVLKAAPDAPLAERQLFSVMANVSLNFVMKATYASKPVYLTVTQ